MPYPPPPGPPDVGEFQAIGKLPAPQLPDVTGHGGDFLETDGIIPQWEPVSGVLPPQAGHAGEFLTTDGATASWAPGGGGSGVTTVGPLTSATANAASITGTTLNLAPADVSNPGVVTTAPQRMGGLKLFPAEAATTVYDVRLYGAVINDTTNDFGQAFYNTLANSPAGIGTLSGLISGSSTISVVMPEGNFYTSMPLCTKAGTYVKGAGPALTGIAPGTVATAEGVHVAGFAGPVFYNQPPYTPSDLSNPSNALFFPSYSTPLVGVTGQSLVLTDNFLSGPISFPLHDSFAWCGWLSETYNLTNWALQFWLKVDDSVPAGFFKCVIGSSGPGVWTSRPPIGTLGENFSDTCFGVWVYSDKVNCYVIAVLTTNPNYDGVFNMQANGTLHYIKSAAVDPSSPLNIELDYDGGHFDLFIDGVSHGHVVATGPILRQPWEGVAIGVFGPESLDGFDSVAAGVNGKIDSIRLSKVARHTGTGSFTPPSSKYTWDSNTMALYNWDQGWKTVQPKDPTGANVGPLLTLPFLVGQTVVGTTGTTDGGPPVVGPAPHFIRLFSPGAASTVAFEDFAITGWNTASGIITMINGWRTRYRRVWTQYCSRVGIANRVGTSFYAVLEDCFAFGCTDFGFQVFGDVRRPQTQACGIAVQMYNGLLDGLLNQPTYKSYIHVLMNGVGSPYNQLTIRHSSNDAEVWNYSRQIAAGVVFGAFSTMNCSDNTWDGGPSNAPSMLYFGLPENVTHTNDLFVSSQASAGTPPNADLDHVFFQFYSLTAPAHNISLYGCKRLSFVTGGSPISNFEDWVSELNGAGATNYRGLSVSDLGANNLAGTFSVLHGFTTGGPIFVTPEPDGNYIVNITPLTYQGSAPAAGSTRILGVATGATGFTATLEADPGGTCQLVFSYTIIRQDPPPEYYSYLPTIPSSFANPLTKAEPFGVGFTLVPAGSHCITFDASLDIQAIVSAGTYASTSFWETNLAGLNMQLSASVGSYDNFGLNNARVVNGKLLNIMNPGAHNVVYSQTSSPTLYLDGTHFVFAGEEHHLGLQPATIYVGERSDTTKPLTSATLRNLKVSKNYLRCFSADSDIGVGSMAQAAFMGDEWTIGWSCAGGLGGYAQQIGNDRYGATYHWMGTVQGGSAVSTDPAGIFSVLHGWLGAQTAPALTSFCLMLGWFDILVYGKTGAETFAGLKTILEGGKATATWTPPTLANNHYAILIYRPPQSSATDSFTFDGHTYSIPFVSDAHTTATNAVSILNAAGTFNTAWDAGGVGDGGTGIWAFVITSKTVGSAGNGVTGTSTGVGTSLVFGDLGGGITGAGLSAKTFAGTDITTTIAGIPVVTNFDTDADTTVNNFIASIVADGTLNPLVTGSLSSHKMVLTANSAGWAGNNISINASFAIGTTFPWTTSTSATPTTLADGFNGAITNGIGTILFCNIPPMKGVVDRPWTSGIEAERVALNGLIAGYSGAGVTIVDVDAAVRDPGDNTQLLPAYNSGNGFPNADGQEAIFTLVAPLLPGVGTPPSSLSYATNPASYANGAPIATNSPTVTGSVVRWTVSPPLPAGLSISSSTGDITGTPTTPTSAANYIVGATNTAGTITVSVNITIT